MTSNYLNITRSIEALDKLIQADRLAAIAFAEVAFNQAVTAAVHNISEIALICNTRIQADSQIAIAKLSSSVEICATELLAHVERSALIIQQRQGLILDDQETVSSMVMEIGRSSKLTISDTAASTIQAIKNQAEDAIKEIAHNSQKAISEIQALSKEVTMSIREQAAIAAERLEDAKKTVRTPENVVAEAEAATNLVLDHSKEALKKLDERANEGLAELNRCVEISTSSLQEVVEAAETRIIELRDVASNSIEDLIRPPPN